MNKLLTNSLLCAIVALCLTVTSCSLTKNMYGISEVEVPLTIAIKRVSYTYANLDKPVRLNVTSTVSEVAFDDSNLNALIRRTLPHYTFTPGVRTFAEDATREYMQKIRIDVSNSADDCLKIDVKNIQVTWADKSAIECLVQLSYSLVNAANESIVPTTNVSANVLLGLASAKTLGEGVGRAYAEALRKINWDRIADCLRTAATPRQEKNAQVTGDGTTALEHTVIRWYIISSPQGADVSWRVVSSTPDVANTNSNFVGSTPYESTESFDIKGLTYNNSGNVQIEVTCEKAGYLPQRKRFNLRQAIDQKEISAKFNLIKED